MSAEVDKTQTTAITTAMIDDCTLAKEAMCAGQQTNAANELKTTATIESNQTICALIEGNKETAVTSSNYENKCATATTSSDSSNILNNGNIAVAATTPENLSTKCKEQTIAEQQESVKCDGEKDYDRMNKNVDNQNVTCPNDKQEPTDFDLKATETFTKPNETRTTVTTQNSSQHSSIKDISNTTTSNITTTTRTNTTNIISNILANTTTAAATTTTQTTATTTTSSSTTNNISVVKEVAKEEKIESKSTETNNFKSTTNVQITTLPPTPLATPTVTPTATPAVTPTATAQQNTAAPLSATSTIQTGQTSKTNVANNINQKTSSANTANSSPNTLLPSAASSSNSKLNNAGSSTTSSGLAAGGSSSNSKSNNHSSSVHNVQPPSAQTNHNRKNEDAPNILVYKKVSGTVNG